MYESHYTAYFVIVYLVLIIRLYAHVLIMKRSHTYVQSLGLRNKGTFLERVRRIKLTVFAIQVYMVESSVVRRVFKFTAVAGRRATSVTARSSLCKIHLGVYKRHIEGIVDFTSAT